ncbi:hypothetical protein JOD55_000198 [Arcanobacterium pluranimalium]|uniref:hypothetical protein n=1 Tax=Arcanobacterium pluranimalium TaxID=108028 RepID=UPI00195D1D0B|nr:hypothetical protein [Arcanobacterium pluranimalium]MBM7824371.1 hypothetical protein [Arcanobacterium pluranimalium]
MAKLKRFDAYVSWYNSVLGQYRGGVRSGCAECDDEDFEEMIFLRGELNKLIPCLIQTGRHVDMQEIRALDAAWQQQRDEQRCD